jgi:hypothetical protein
MMTKFEDQLFTDLMKEYRPVLQRLERPVATARARRVPARRAAWLAGVATAGAAAAGVLLLGGGTPAYAVTQHPDGTVTVSIAGPAGVRPANVRLRVLGDPVVVVPVGPGCPSVASLPKPQVTPSGTISVGGSDSGGTLTVDAHGVPAGDTMIIAASTLPGGGTQLGAALISGPAPSCVSLPAIPSGGSGRSSGGSTNG